MKRLLKKLHHYFIPHAGNDFKAHIFRDTSLGILSLIVIMTFVLGVAHKYALTSTNYLAAIYSGMLVDLANEDRIENSLRPLNQNPVLEAAAQLKAEDMAAKGYFSHYGPDGSAPWDWMKKAGYEFVYAGENLAVDFTDSEDVDNAWMNSPTHKANILNSKYTEIGIATVKGKYNGRNTIFVVQMFGTPRAVAQSLPVISPVPLGQLAQNTTPGDPEVQGAVATEKEPEVKPAPASVTKPATNPIAKAPIEKINYQESFVEIEGDNIVAAAPQVTEISKNSPEPVRIAKEISTNPGKTLGIIYGVVSLALITGLSAMIRKDLDTHHLLHASGGVVVMVMIVSLTYIYNHAIFSDTIIVAVNSL